VNGAKDFLFSNPCKKNEKIAISEKENGEVGLNHKGSLNRKAGSNAQTI